MPNVELNNFPPKAGFRLYDDNTGDLKLGYFTAAGELDGGYPFVSIRDTGDGAFLILHTIHGGLIKADTDGKVVVDR